MNDSGIVRNKMKINADINNASALVKLEQKYGSFVKFLKKFIPEPIINHPQNIDYLSTYKK